MGVLWVAAIRAQLRPDLDRRTWIRFESGNRTVVQKPDAKLLRFKARYSVLLQTRHPRPVPGNQGRKLFLWLGWREVVTQDDLTDYYHIVMIFSIWETVLFQVGIPTTNNRRSTVIC
jgi:hypothetical protein